MKIALQTPASTLIGLVLFASRWPVTTSTPDGCRTGWCPACGDRRSTESPPMVCDDKHAIAPFARHRPARCGMTEASCPGGGKSWSVDKAGKPICPRCYRGLIAVAGKGRSIRDLPKVPRHAKPSRGDDQTKVRRSS